MKDLLLRENTEVLAQLAWTKVLLAFDFDGTLAPIVDDREEAQMRDRTAQLFANLCVLYPCAVISGRSHDDVSARLGNTSVKYVIGNHGLEPGAQLHEFEEQTRFAREYLEAELRGTRGIDVEDKRYSLAIHYRSSRQKRAALQTIRSAVSKLPEPVKLISGKLVVNVLPAGAPNKGDALLEIRDAESADTALYVGDDVTDEDVFVLDQPGRLLSVRVGESRSSSAAYYLRGQRDIDRLLSRLIALRDNARTGSAQRVEPARKGQTDGQI